MKTQSEDRLVVLLAEDDESDLILTRRAFHLLGNLERLIWMPDGERTMQYLQAEGAFSDRTMWPMPTILILDQSMPRITGIDVLRWIRSQPNLAHLPVVILSGVLPLMEPNIAGQFHAACCVKTSNAHEAAGFLAEAICSALQMAWWATLSKAGADRPPSGQEKANNERPAQAQVLPSLGECQRNSVPLRPISGVKFAQIAQGRE